MEKRLSRKEKGFVRDIVKGKTGTQAVLDNYDTTNENSASVIAVQNLRKVRIQNAIKSIADKIPDELLEKVHLEGLTASRQVGETLEADYAVRHKYLDTAYKLKGTYAPEKTISDININTLSDEEQTKLLSILKDE